MNKNLYTKLLTTTALIVAGQSWMQSAGAHDDAPNIDFAIQVQPILESACLNCHNDTDTEGGLSLETLAAAMEGGEQGASLVPGDPDASSLFSTMVLPPDHDQVMPPEGELLAESQTDIIRRWIEEGAMWPEELRLETQARMSFTTHIQPILETHCVSCHHSDGPEGGYDLTTRGAAFETGDQASSLIAFHPDESLLYSLTALDESDDQLMPPYDEGGPLDAEEIEQLRLWVAQGAVWPDDIRLKPRIDLYTTNPDNKELVREIHALIVARAEEERDQDSGDYTETIPRSGIDFSMIAIKEGDFLMGSPDSEEFRSDNEGPQTKVHVAPFWMGKFEVTWDEYEPFMVSGIDRFKNGTRKDFDPEKHGIIDTISQPTNPFIEMSFGMGQAGYPAISMTQHAANKYCQWLSAQTGHFYRLPTEAEWEYACRAGTTTAFSFGDSLDDLSDYGWYYDNSNEKYERVGQKKPNPWGLYDMHGNVMEWTIDQYLPDYYAKIQLDTNNPLIRPTELYPRTVRGGNWDDDPEQLRSAIRRGSDPNWKIQDPQLPKSLWYHTDARGLGFRIVRPTEVPTVEEMYFYWNSATDVR